jgi:hypothetical protein
MIWIILLGIAVSLALSASAAVEASAKSAKPNRIDVRYVPPKSAEHQRLFELVKERRALEKVQELLKPIRLPRRLLLKTEGCEGVSNAWYDGEAVTICYEYLDDIWKNAAQEITPAGIAPIDTVVGPFVDVVLHEVGHAVFDILEVPLFGREEDAADQFSVFLMLRFQKDEARRLILGNAYQYKADVQSPTVSMALKKFADEHGTPSQRFFNVLCMAYGADKALFAEFVQKEFLPKERAEGCEDEYAQVTRAFNKLIFPHVDRKLVRKLHKRWLPPVDQRPKRRQETGIVQ